MSIAKTVELSIQSMPKGKVFEYRELPGYATSPDAVIKAVNRLVSKKSVIRFSKGRFYTQKEGILGERNLSDVEIIRTFTHRNGKVRGYITGLALFNKFGLTTQIPRTVTISVNGSRQYKDFGTIRVKTVTSRAPIKEDRIQLLQFLDVLKDIKRIPDSTIDEKMKIMTLKIGSLSEEQIQLLLTLARDFYTEQTKAILGLIYQKLGYRLYDELNESLNPQVKIRLNLNNQFWPESKNWNIE